MSSASHWASVVFACKLTEWRRFQFCYQPSEALSPGSAESSFAFWRSINPLTAKPIKRNENICENKILFVPTHWKQSHVRMIAHVKNYPVCLKQFQHKSGSSNHYLNQTITHLVLFVR